MRHRMLVPLQLLVRDTPPQGTPATGDIYFNTEEKSIQVFDGEQWGGIKGFGGEDEILITPTAPDTETTELWVDTGTAGGDVVSPDSGSHVTTIGNGTDTTITITHNLGTQDILLSLWLTGTGELVTTDITSIDDSSISLTFEAPPGPGAIKAVIASAASRGGGIDRNYVDRRIWQGTEAEYNTITTKNPATIYSVTASTGTTIHVNGGTSLHTDGPVTITDHRLRVTGPDGGVDISEGHGVAVHNAPVLIRSTTSAGKFTSDGGSFEVIHKPDSNPGTQVGFWRKQNNVLSPLIAEQPHEPITKAYLDASQATGGGFDEAATGTRYVNVAGDMMTGPLELSGDPAGERHAATKGYIDTRTPPIIVLGPDDPVPPGTAAGTIIIRTEQ